jgi:hypothetical protein
MRAFDGRAIDVIQIGGTCVATAFAQAFGDFGYDGVQTHFQLQIAPRIARSINKPAAPPI